MGQLCNACFVATEPASEIISELRPDVVPMFEDCEPVYIANIKQVYTKWRFLGDGVSSSVFEAIRDGNIVAIKLTKVEDETFHEFFAQEISILRKVDHINILKYSGLHIDHKYICIETEILRGRELFDEIIHTHYDKNEKFNDTDFIKIASEILSSIIYLHSKNIVHRDIKPENFVLKGNSIRSGVKLIDFGIAIEIKPKEKYPSRIGTIPYCPPETFKSSKRTGEQLIVGDVWAVGIVLFVMISGSQHVSGKRDNEIIKNIKKNKLHWKDLTDCSKETVDYLKMILEPNWKKRVSAKEALKNLPKKLDATMNFSQLQAFQKERKIRKVVKKLVKQSRSGSEQSLKLKSYRRAFRDYFSLVDEDNSGEIDQEELRGYLVHVKWPEFKIQSTIEAIFDKLDDDNSGTLDIEELEEAWDHYVLQKDGQLCGAIFNVLANDDGKVSITELKKLFGDNARDTVALFDVDGDGEIDYDEFVEVIRGDAAGDDNQELAQLFDSFVEQIKVDDEMAADQIYRMNSEVTNSMGGRFSEMESKFDSDHVITSADLSDSSVRIEDTTTEK